MAYKGDWKKVKSLLADSTGSRGRWIAPILAHWNSEPVRAKPETSQYVQATDADYSYLVTLIKRSGKYQVNLYIYALNFDEIETPLMFEVKHFSVLEYKGLIDFLTTPSKLFSIRKKHKKVRLYTQTRMTEEEFEKEIELCRKKQT